MQGNQQRVINYADRGQISHIHFSLDGLALIVKVHALDSHRIYCLYLYENDRDLQRELDNLTLEQAYLLRLVLDGRVGVSELGLGNAQAYFDSLASRLKINMYN
jgi:hypothetical protein